MICTCVQHSYDPLTGIRWTDPECPAHSEFSELPDATDRLQAILCLQHRRTILETHCPTVRFEDGLPGHPLLYPNVPASPRGGLIGEMP